MRVVADNKIAPYAAEVDADLRYPQEAHDALVAADFFAPHVSEDYDGVGADALATCIVIEEVARACASFSLIPAVNKLGGLPLILAGTRISNRGTSRHWPEARAASHTGSPNATREATPPR